MTSVPDPTKAWLSLPTASPPEALSGRLRIAYRQRWRRLRVAGLAGALALSAAVLLPMGLQGPVPIGNPPGAVADTGPIRSIPTTAPAPELQAIDRALQAAYARGASDAALAPLWAARQALTGETPGGSGHLPTTQRLRS